ncbi:Zonadhesin, partial [Durusdinium trenchii]
RHRESTESVPRDISMAIRKVNGQVSRKEKALKVQLEAVKEKEKANKEAEAKAAKTLEAIKSHTEDFTNRAQKSREALAALEDAVSAHVGKGEDLQRAKSAWKMLADKVDNMTANLTAQRNESTVKIDAIKQALNKTEAEVEKEKAKRNEAEKAMNEAEAQLAQLGDIKKTKAQEHEKLEAEMHAARDAMQKHQLLLDDAIAAVDAAAAQADQATKQAKVLDNEHEEQKQGLMMLKAVRGSIDSFYHKLQALSESMEETHGETSKSAPERMKEDPNLKPSLESYNAMVQSFHDLHAFSSKLYGTIQPAVTQIKHNAFSEILVECDPGENLEREADESKDFTKLQEACGSGLWKAVGLARLRFPAFEGKEEKEDQWWDESVEETNLLVEEEAAPAPPQESEAEESEPIQPTSQQGNEETEEQTNPTDKMEEPLNPTDKTEEPVNPPDKTEEPVNPPDETEEPVNPADKTEELVNPTDKTEEPLNPPDKTEEPVNPTDKTEEPVNPTDKTEELLNPADKMEEPVNPPDKTEEPVNPPDKTEEPVNPTDKTEEALNPSEKTEEPLNPMEEPLNPTDKTEEPLNPSEQEDLLGTSGNEDEERPSPSGQENKDKPLSHSEDSQEDLDPFAEESEE